MKEEIEQDKVRHVGEHLKLVVRFAAFGGLFFSISSTLFIWAGSDSFHCSAVIWKTSLAINLFLFSLTWVVYLPFRKTDRLIGQGLLSIFMFISLFWMFGFSMFYFYFLFAPISIWPRALALTCVTTMLIYRGHIIARDIRQAFQKEKSLFSRMYFDEGSNFTYSREAFLLLQKSRKDRNPFKSFHAYAAMIVAPFVLVLNRISTPILGDGHGVFLIVAFFAVPILLWGVEMFVQTVMTMIYYPIKLERETGKPVLLKDW